MIQLKQRAFWPDNLRFFIIVLVVVMHSNVTWSGLGGWYFTPVKAASLSVPELVFFGLYGSFTQAWFMGALFFLSGYLASFSHRRKGGARFLAERIVRLGLPLLFFMFIVQPLTVWGFLDWQGTPLRESSFIEFYKTYIGRGMFWGGNGPLWFVAALIPFAAAQTLWRKIRPFRPAAAAAADRRPTTEFLLLLAAGIGLAAFAIRLVMPVGTNVLNFQLCFFASYIALYALGINAGERNWLESVCLREGRTWLARGLGIGLPVWAAIMVFGGPLKGQMLINGGWNWQALTYALWEGFIAVSFSIGLCTVFRVRFDRGGKLQKILADNSFGVYMLHAPVLIALSLPLAPLGLPHLVKHAITSVLALGLTLIVSWQIVRRIPGLRKIIR